jgi:hypothetical protein
MLAVITCLVLPATATLAVAGQGSKNCAAIDGCAASVSSPSPPPMAILGGQPQPASRLAVAVATAPTATLNESHQSGKLLAAAEGGRRVRCGGYRLRAPTTFQFQLLTASPASITYDITDRITNIAAQGAHFCLAANFAFKTLSGRRAPAARLPDGTRGHIGLLPPCPASLPPAGFATAPCVEQVTTVNDSNSTTGVDVILKVRVPTRTSGGAAGDPWGGG